MRRFFRKMIAGTLIAAAFSSTSFAANFDSCADRLKAMGLFRGSNTGYELDRAPTRAEAAAMLVRLLGKEEEALKLTYTAPFSDLKGWEKPYVQYLYENGLTTGTTAVTFSPNINCSSQMFAAFLLRTLGYTDKEFKYDDAIKFAGNIGLYSAETVDISNFLRDHMVAASYTALSLNQNGKDTVLLDELINDGAVSPASAAEYKGLLDKYNTYLEAVKKTGQLSAASLKHELSVKTNTLSISSTETIDMDLKAPARSSKRQSTLSAPGVEDKTVTAESYVANNKYYLVQNGNVSTKEISGTEFELLASNCFASAPLAAISDIARSGNTYNISYNGAGLKSLNGALEALTSAAGTLEDMKLTNISVQHTIDDGLISCQQVALSFESEAFSGSVSSRMTLEKINDDVTVTPPSGITPA